MKDFLDFMGVLLIAALAGGLIYTTVKKKLALAIWMIAGILVVGILWWWLSSTSTPSTPSVPGAGWSWSPTPSDVWVFFKDYWMWVILVLTGLYFLFDGITSAPAWSKGAKGMVVAVAVLMAGAMAVHGIWGESSSSQQATRSEIPLASSPKSTWPKLVIPAGSRSKLIPVPQGMHVAMVGGNKFRLYTVYQDGQECAFGDLCPIAPQKGVYARNEAMETNIVSYAYVQD